MTMTPAAELRLIADSIGMAFSYHAARLREIAEGMDGQHADPPPSPGMTFPPPPGPPGGWDT